MWLTFQRQAVLLPAYKHQACKVRRYDNTYRKGQKKFRTYKAFESYRTELLLAFSKTSNTCVLLYKNMGGPF